MKQLSLTLIGAALLAAAPAENTLSQAERRDGWTLLFDGQSTSEWEEVTGKSFPTGSWRIENECLRAYTGTAGRQDIRTKSRFTNFELQFEWKLPEAGNSGVKYFVQRVDEWTNKDGRQARGRGLEYQLAPCGASEFGPERSCGSLYSVIAPHGTPVAKAGEFHRSTIIVRSGKVEHWLNGRRVVAFDVTDAKVSKVLRSFETDGPELQLKGSFIVLQNHGSDTWFRNIKLRELP